ncbi:hypothetical protein CDE51_08100 [Pasteurella multocida]|nr:hypothetical protein CDE51_08100 [Pasteurella multocida]
MRNLPNTHINNIKKNSPENSKTDLILNNAELISIDIQRLKSFYDIAEILLVLTPNPKANKINQLVLDLTHFQESYRQQLETKFDDLLTQLQTLEGGKKMITHMITLPDGTKIEFFASDEELFNKAFSNTGLTKPLPRGTLKQKNNSQSKKKKIRNSKRKNRG